MSPASSTKTLFDHCSLDPLTLVNLETDHCFRLVRWSPLQVSVCILINVMELFKMVDFLDELFRDTQLSELIVLHISNLDPFLKLSGVFLKVSDLSCQFINFEIFCLPKLYNSISKALSIFLVSSLGVHHCLSQSCKLIFVLSASWLNKLLFQIVVLGCHFFQLWCKLVYLMVFGSS